MSDVNAIMGPDETPENRFMTSDNACIPFRRQGCGPALIMIHGWSQSGAMFKNQLTELAKYFDVVVPDLRGHGNSPDPASGLRMARLAADIKELMAHLGIARAHMLGWSMGASVIWSFIDLFGTDSIDRLVFVDQPISLMITQNMDDEERLSSGALFTFADLEELSASLLGPAGEEVRAGFLRSMVTPAIPDDLFSWIQQENTLTSLRVASTMLVSHCMQDWRDVLPRIDRPSLIIGGAISHVNPRSQRYVHERISGSIYHEFGADEGGAHFPFLEAPRRFNAVVSSFLQG